MTEVITVRIQVGVQKGNCFSMTIPWDFTVDEMRTQLRAEQKIDPSYGVVLISNGENLRNPDITLYDLGICSDSLVICIISKSTGKDIEALIGDESEESKDIKVVLEVEFNSRPFGFAVWADERGENAIVTKVSGSRAIEKGIKIGYCVYKVNDSIVYHNTHTNVLLLLKTIACPTRIQFLDFGDENTIEFSAKPLGFTVVMDNRETNAKVSKVTQDNVKQGVKIGSLIVAVNGQYVYGWQHKAIINVINNSKFPIRITFRKAPKLLILSTEGRRSNIMKRTGKKKLTALPE